MINRVLAVLVAILSALALGELLLRVSLPRDRFSRDLVVTDRPDPVLYRVHVPGSTGHSVAELREDGFDVRYRYDQHGMRGDNDVLDDPHPGPAPSRVMLLGDSFIEQRQLADADLIQTRLVRMLADTSSPAPHVFGYGVSGWSPIEYTLYYKTRARGFRPTILFVFLTFNDYRDDSLTSPGCQFSPAGEPLSCPAPSDAYRAALNSREPSRWMLFDLFRHARISRAWTAPGLRDLLGSGFRMDGSDELLGILDPKRIDSTLPIVRRSFGFLRGLFDAARRDGARPVLVMIPWPQQVGAAEWELGRPMWGVPVDRLEPSTVLQDVTVQVARESGIETLDLLPILRARAARDRMFFPFDGHFTPAAASVVAGALADVVRQAPR